MKCLIGLGNPGDQYKNTKHNFGYWVVDSYLEKSNLKLKLGKGDYVFAKNGDFIIAKTATAMNNSGHAVKSIIDYFNLNLEDVIIIYDDIDIRLGNIRFKTEGSTGGHNGIKSIIYHLNTDVFNRLKIGIATEQNMRPSEKYVLKPFSKEYKKIISEVINDAVDGINYYLENGIKKSMNNFN